MKSITPQSALRGTAILLLGRVFNRFLGLAREIISASLFGTGMAMDCFNLSYIMVTGMRKVFAEQFLTPVVPSYFKRRKEAGEEAALVTLQSITTRLNLTTLVISIIIFLLARQIIQLLAPGFDPEKIELSATILRWFAIGGIAYTLYLYMSGLHTCFFRYTVISVAPLLFNIGAITAMMLFAFRFGVVSLAAGLSLGFLAYHFVVMFSLPHRDDILRLRWVRRDPGLTRYGLMLFPLFIAVSFEQVQLFVDRALASGLPEGVLSAQGYALRLVQMISNTFLGSFGTVIFPIFASLAVGGKKEEFARNFSLAFQGAMLILLPASAIIVALAKPIIQVLFERGAFSHEDSLLTSSLIVYYAIAFTAQALFIVIVRGFHAHSNTRVPMYTSLISVAVMISADFILVKPMGIFGLALATVIGYTLNMVLVYIVFTRHLTIRATLDNIRIASLIFLIAALIVFVIDRTWNYLETTGLVENLISKLAGIIILTILTTLSYICLLYILRVPAFQFLIQKLKQKRKPIIPSEPENY